MRILLLGAMFLSGILSAQQPAPQTSISGRLLDEHGKPVPHAWQVLLREQYIDGRKQLTPVPGSGAKTNERGEFRVEGVWTGPVILLFTPMQPALKEFAGIPAEVATEEFSATYHPGTADVSQAARIDLKPGAQATGLETRIVRLAANPVRGRVLDHAGQPARDCALMLVPHDLRYLPLESARLAKTTAGSFEFRDLPAGSYDLVVRIETPRMIHRDSVVVTRGERLELRLPAPVRLEVQVSSQGARLNPAWVYIGLHVEGEGGGSLPSAVPVPGDVTKFAFEAVMPGRYRISASLVDPRAPKGSFDVESIWYGELKLGDQPFEVTANPSPIRVILR